MAGETKTIDWTQTRISATVDVNGDGRQIGDLRLPHSNNRYALGYVPVPIAVLRNGEGPTVLLVAGNHGDEYEGQVALLRLTHDVDLETLRGRLIILPFLNAPAVRAGARVSPLDDANMNRAFPGDPDGGPTAMLAHLVESVLMPVCDAVLDLHSGGKAAYFTPCTLVSRLADRNLLEAGLALADAFAAPMILLLGEMSDNRTLNSAAARQGVPMMSTELGGAGTVTRSVLDLTHGGIVGCLIHVGVMRAEAATESRRVPRRCVAVGGHDHYVIAPARGLFEPAFEAGDQVEAGQEAGTLYAVDEPERPPLALRFAVSGTVIAKRIPTLVERGIMLATVGSDVEP